VLTASGYTDDVRWLPGTGSPAAPFGSAVAIATASEPERALLGDLDADGNEDLIVAESGASHVNTWLGDGLGGFASSTGLPTPGVPTALLALDLSLDGRLDIVSALPDSGAVARIVQDSSTGLAILDVASLGDAPSAITASDIDADGRVDIVAALLHDDWIAIVPDAFEIPPGVSAFGSGSPSCRGRMGAGTNISATPGALDFGFGFTNLMPRRTGIGLLGLVGLPSGSDVLGLGFLWHVGPFVPLITFPMQSDAGGVAAYVQTLANDPTIVGATLYLQTVWIEPIAQTCASSPFGITSTRGLQLTIQP
jgi:hypothetical protein